MMSLCATAALMFGAANTVHAQAQTILWGAGSSDPVIDSIGRFAAVDAADTTVGSAGWTAISVFDTDGVNTPGAALWIRQTTGVSRGAYWGTRDPMTSPSRADGHVIFDSDFLARNGELANAPMNGTSPVPHRGILESPVMDLSAAAGAGITISFHTFYRLFQVDEMSLEISLDGGTTWTNNVDIRAEAGITAVNAQFQGQVNVTIGGAFLTSPSSALTNAKLRFVFEGNYYFWMIDDVSVSLAPAYDLAISGVTNGNTLGDGFTISHVAGYEFQPLSQVDAFTFNMGARVRNNGVADIVPDNNAQLNLVIEEDVAGTWTEVHRISIPMDSVAAQTRVTYDSLGIGWVPTQTGDYRATYFVSHDSSDFTATNDSSAHTFSITDNYFSRVRFNTLGQPGTTRAIYPGAAAGNNVAGFEYGSMFYFPRGADDQLTIDSFVYRAFVPTDTVVVSEAPITINVYEHNVVPTGSDNLTADAANLRRIAIAVDTISINPSLFGQYVARTVTDFIFLEDDTQPVTFLNDKIYMFSLSQESSLVLSRAVGGRTEYNGIFYGASNNNYSINLAQRSTMSSAAARTRFVTLDAAGTTASPVSNDWNWIGFGGDIQPSMGVYLGDLTVSTVAREASIESFKLFPNPTSNILNIEVGMKEREQAATLILTDINGRVLTMRTEYNVQNEVYTLDVNHLPTGVYFLSIQTEKGSSTERFIKQ